MFFKEKSRFIIDMGKIMRFKLPKEDIIGGWIGIVTSESVFLRFTVKT